MKTIHKYPLSYENTTLFAPSDFTPLHVEVQNGIPCLWALVETSSAKKNMIVYCLGTGTGISFDGLRFLGTVVLHREHLVWHFFLG